VRGLPANNHHKLQQDGLGVQLEVFCAGPACRGDARDRGVVFGLGGGILVGETGGEMGLITRERFDNIILGRRMPGMGRRAPIGGVGRLRGGGGDGVFDLGGFGAA